MGIKKANKKDKFFVEKELEKELSNFIDSFEEMKKKPSDYFTVKVVYFDERGKFISAKKYRALKRQGKNVKRKNIFILKVDLPEFNLKAGDKIPDDKIEEVLDYIKEQIKYHNTIVGIMLRHDMSYEEAKELVDSVFKLYDEGVIDWRDVHEVFSP